MLHSEFFFKLEQIHKQYITVLLRLICGQWTSIGVVESTLSHRQIY